MKKIISKDIIDEVQSSYNSLAEQGTAKCEEYKFRISESFAVGPHITVIKADTTGALDLKPEVKKEYLKEWKKDVGNLMSVDFKKNRAQGKYFEFRTPTTKTLLRRVDDSEYDELNKQNFIHVKFGDYYYTILIHTNLDKAYMFAYNNDEDIVVEEKEEDETDDYVYTEEPEQESLSLFE